MAALYDIDGVAGAVGLSRTTVGNHRADPTCPLHGRGMRRQRGSRKLFASAEVLANYRRWLTELVPTGDDVARAAS